MNTSALIKLLSAKKVKELVVDMEFEKQQGGRTSSFTRWAVDSFHELCNSEYNNYLTVRTEHSNEALYELVP